MKVEKIIKKDKWELEQDSNYSVEYKSDYTTINNLSTEKIEIKYMGRISFKNADLCKLKINCKGDFVNAGGYLFINDCIKVPINSTSIIDIKPPVSLNIKLIISAESSVTIQDIVLEALDGQVSLVDDVSTSPDVLIITPAYPSLDNLYNCAFAHSRNKEYANSGLNIQVASISSNNWFQTIYAHDGIPVFKGAYIDLKSLLLRHQYKVIIIHFVDENLFSILDGYTNKERIIFICHGPETVFRYLQNVTRPYFTNQLPYPTQNEIFDLKEQYIRKYSQKDNIEWVFVSEWLKNFSEEELKLKFKHSRVINNIINEELFPYSPKNEKDRLKILIIRKFDNIIQHSIDQVVLSILELSRRDFFDKLTFEIYGDGAFYDELINPISEFSNVHLHRTFLPNNKISSIHKNSGILLIPSRHDAHAVAMGEGASSGLVVVGSRVTSNPFFMNEKENRTLADPEDYVGLANIIERLYRNPKEFLEISERLSSETRKNCCKANTVQKEIELIRENLTLYKQQKFTVDVKPSKQPTLTIAIPAYNVEKYIEKCLDSIISASNIEDIEVLVINDGSTDNTGEIVKKYSENTNGIIKLINKENGGHGSAINVSIENAKGKYFRLVDGDDWVDSENLTLLVNILKTVSSDIILTKGSYEYIESARLEDIIKYDNLLEGHVYYLDDLVYKGYGFNTYGPLLTTGNYRTEILKNMNIKISEKKPYVDMEFNAFSLKLANTLEYYNLDIYRYLMGREGQTISRDYWSNKYKEHEYVIFNILQKVYDSNEFSTKKKKYIYNNIITQMVDSQIFMFDFLCLWNQIDVFLEKLKKYDGIYEICLKFITNKDGNCRLILEKYREVLLLNNYKEPIVIPGIREKVKDLEMYPVYRKPHIINVKMFIKKSIKFITPYGLLRLYKKVRNN